MLFDSSAKCPFSVSGGCDRHNSAYDARNRGRWVYSKITNLVPSTDPVTDRLNLTKASRLHILEPQWNPSIEAQAIGRVFRLGQEKNVVITRYIVQNTVEEVRDPSLPLRSGILNGSTNSILVVHSIATDSEDSTRHAGLAGR